MKLIAALGFLFASVVGAPAPCSHAMGQDVANEASQAMNDSHAHYAMDHRTPEADHDDGAVGHQGHDCADGCEGGFACKGCTITNAAISIVDEFNRQFVSHEGLAASFVAGADKPTTLDPPPPRA